MSRPLNYKDIAPGVKLGAFLITDKIAQGGMGAVFKAFDPALERSVAIKVLRPEYARDEEYLNYFQQEARAVAQLQHGNIVPIYTIGMEGEILYFAMAYIDGNTFDDWIEAGHKMSADDAMWFMTQAVGALECAWRSRIIHLDIKPANFLIDPANVVMLTDFGLAQKVSGTEVLDTERDAFGTPAYVAPEQITRDKTDLRTDIYSLGATLYHLMVGSPPFDGSTVEDIVWGHLEKAFPAKKALDVGVPEGWVALMRRMMERNPNARFQDYAEIRDALANIETFRYQKGYTAAPVPKKEVAPPPPTPPEKDSTVSDGPISGLSAEPRANANVDTLHGFFASYSVRVE